MSKKFSVLRTFTFLTLTDGAVWVRIIINFENNIALIIWEEGKVVIQHNFIGVVYNEKRT